MNKKTITLPYDEYQELIKTANNNTIKIETNCHFEYQFINAGSYVECHDELRTEYLGEKEALKELNDKMNKYILDIKEFKNNIKMLKMRIEYLSDIYKATRLLRYIMKKIKHKSLFRKRFILNRFFKKYWYRY